MPALQRSVSMKGAKFYRQGGKLMFVLHIDASTRDGPREATAEDLDAYPDAFAAFEEDDDGGAIGPLARAEADPPPQREVPAKRGKGAFAK